MKFAYADPPYIGQAKKHYGNEESYAGEVDHTDLLCSLKYDYPDGWALSCSTPSLQDILWICHTINIHPRVAAWVKPFASFKPGVNPAYAWEPVLFMGGRKRERDVDTVRDWVSSRKARLGREHKRWQPSGRRYIGNGEHIALITLDGLATWAWRRQDFRKDEQTGIECSIFRNVGPCPSSGLVEAAVAWSWERWPGYPLFTYCKATLTRGGKRLIRWGECFWQAGWKLMDVDGLRFCWALEWPEVAEQPGGTR